MPAPRQRCWVVAATAMRAPTILKFLRLARFPILRQLQLEQALLRVSDASWLLVNDGTPDPTIVMGISGCAAIRHCFWRPRCTSRRMSLYHDIDSGAIKLTYLIKQQQAATVSGQCQQLQGRLLTCARAQLMVPSEGPLACFCTACVTIRGHLWFRQKLDALLHQQPAQAAGMSSRQHSLHSAEELLITDCSGNLSSFLHGLVQEAGRAGAPAGGAGGGRHSHKALQRRWHCGRGRRHRVCHAHLQRGSCSRGM